MTRTLAATTDIRADKRSRNAARTLASINSVKSFVSAAAFEVVSPATPVRDPAQALFRLDAGHKLEA
jgi:hypothetical protein